jgi:hypothetical protein
MSKEIPILFSTPMVQAILAGRKTQTRRVVKPQPLFSEDGGLYEGKHKGYVRVDGHLDWQRQFAEEFAPYQEGDILWVRETWQHWLNDNGNPSGDYLYKADECGRNGIGWKPSLFMPRKACRLFLKVTEVRAERLQDISGKDAVAEGVRSRLPDNGIAQSEFQDIWDSINAKKCPWESNPWVWVITFKKYQP